jgi:phosphoribosyl-AMP cyclohydrolase
LDLAFEKSGGLIPVIVQEHASGEVLMLAYMNREAWAATLATRVATFYSRSRRSLWVKGETSGNIQKVIEIRVDCDRDTVLLRVEQVGGAACHTGHKSCFHNRVENGTMVVVGTPVFDPREVYHT